jgi:predicted acylesterase/phospholipase RssA
MEAMTLSAGEQRRRIRLALSGGGFRATLFHLGVVRYLRETRQLENVIDICSVSGGSILAAHLVLNWDKYNGTKERFQEATDELIKFIQFDVRGRTLRRWILSWVLVVFLWVTPPSVFLFWIGVELMPVLSSLAWLVVGGAAIFKYMRYWSLVRALERQYDTNLFHGARLADLGSNSNAPTVRLLATNLTTGEMCFFDKQGFHLFGGDPPAAKPYPGPDRGLVQ